MDIVKKSKKWQCRVCNIKQSVRKEYFRGTGTECRAKVQELNLSKGQKQNETVNNFLELLNNDESEFLEDFENEIVEERSESICETSAETKFEQYHEQNENESIFMEFNQTKRKEIPCTNVNNYKQNTAKKSKWAKFEQDQKQIKTVLELLNDDENTFLENDKDEANESSCANVSNKAIEKSSHEQEISTLFNFSQTKKWSTGIKSMQTHVDQIPTAENIMEKCNPPKKSKWDNYL